MEKLKFTSVKSLEGSFPGLTMSRFESRLSDFSVISLLFCLHPAGVFLFPFLLLLLPAFFLSKTRGRESACAEAASCFPSPSPHTGAHCTAGSRPAPPALLSGVRARDGEEQRPLVWGKSREEGNFWQLCCYQKCREGVGRDGPSPTADRTERRGSLKPR